MRQLFADLDLLLQLGDLLLSRPVILTSFQSARTPNAAKSIFCPYCLLLAGVVNHTSIKHSNIVDLFATDNGDTQHPF